MGGGRSATLITITILMTKTMGGGRSAILITITILMTKTMGGDRSATLQSLELRYSRDEIASFPEMRYEGSLHYSLLIF